MVFPVLVGVVGIAAATVCVVSLDDDSLTVKLKTTDKTNFLSHEQLSQKVLLWEKILRFFPFSFFFVFVFIFTRPSPSKNFPTSLLSSSSSSKFFPSLFSFLLSFTLLRYTKNMNTVARRGQSLLLRLAELPSSSSSSSRVLSSLFSSSSSQSERGGKCIRSESHDRGVKNNARAFSSSFVRQQQRSSNKITNRKWISTSATTHNEEEEKPSSSPPVDDDTVVVDLSKGENTTPPSSKIIKLAEEIVKLNMLEINDLGQILQEKMGISDQQLYGMGGGSMGMGGGGGGVNVATTDAASGGAATEPEAAQTEFSLKLDAFDASSKIKVIKEVRAATELGLKEAKELVEGAPCVLKKGLSKEDAEAMMAKIVAAGATCSLE